MSLFDVSSSRRILRRIGGSAQHGPRTLDGEPSVDVNRTLGSHSSERFEGATASVPDEWSDTERLDAYG